MNKKNRNNRNQAIIVWYDSEITDRRSCDIIQDIADEYDVDFYTVQRILSAAGRLKKRNKKTA
ncbi:MAG: hypothetical protein PHU98_06235 [Mariniphaga sp.]|jgi:hypothetical protein|nr:hypothetical protein [Mariniphaga sp.]